MNRLRASAGGGGPVSLGSFSASNPLYIAHRGGWLRAPEHTYEAYDLSRSLGVAAIEQDVWQLTDNGLGIMHDTTVDRTTSGTGNATSFSTATFQALTVDASTWFTNPVNADQPARLWQEVVARYQGSVIFVPEVKNSGAATHLLAAIQAAGISANQVLVQSFTLSDLAGFTAAGFQTIFLTGSGTEDKETVWAAGVRWVGISGSLSDTIISAWVARGFKVVPYTILRRIDRDRLLGLGCAGMFTPDPEYLMGGTRAASTDNFSSQRWQRGMFNKFDNLGSTLNRGAFYSPNYWGFSAASDGSTTHSVLQGWACPVGNNAANSNWSVTTDVTYVSTFGGSTTRWGGVFVPSLALLDREFTDEAGTGQNGYNCILRKNGSIVIFRVDDGVATQVATASSAAIADNEEIRLRVTVSATQIVAQRLTLAGAVVQTATATDNTHARSGYFHFCRNGCEARFRNVVTA